MKKIYIILTHTGTTLSNIIKYYTKDEFTHVSIALDADLEKMYSFGRLNPYNPFWGGFVHEELHKGTFKRFRKTRAEVYSLFVDDEQYSKIEKRIEYFQEYKDKYKFNVAGLFGVSIKKIVRRKNSFYCAEFVRHIMKFSGIKTDVLPQIIKPEDFLKFNGLKLEYEGLLRKYQKKSLPKLEEISRVLQGNRISYI